MNLSLHEIPPVAETENLEKSLADMSIQEIIFPEPETTTIQQLNHHNTLTTSSTEYRTRAHQSADLRMRDIEHVDYESKP